jgi:Zinc carboxypeptidase
MKLLRKPVVVSLVALIASLLAAVAQARIVTIGHSVEGLPIKADVIGPNSAPRKILLVGCIHGNECAGRAILSAVAGGASSEVCKCGSSPR